MESLSDSLKQRFARHGINQAVSAATDLETIKRVLPTYVVPKTIRAGVLTVEIGSPAAAFTFQQDLDGHLERINAALGQATITRLKVRLTYA